MTRWPDFVARLEHFCGRLNLLFARLSMLATVLASMVLTSSVVLRYVLHVPTDWQDEVAVFLLVFMTFGASAWVQQRRGHIAIDAGASLLTPQVNAWRIWSGDLFVLAFCSFFAVKSWVMVHEAWAEGMTTSSDWAPPLWFPYGLMALGASLLVLQVLVQVLAGPKTVKAQTA